MSKSVVPLLVAAAVAVAAVAVVYINRSRRPASAVAPAGTAPAATGPASLLGNLFGQQVELASGHILDTETGVIYDPATGNYTNTYTGQLIYRGAQ